MQKLVKHLPNCSDHERANWYIGPVGHHRDSDAVEESNWQHVCIEFLVIDPDGFDHTILRFGHWAVGWVEEIAYRPGSKVAELAAAFKSQLESYPLLNEEIYAELEHDDEC